MFKAVEKKNAEMKEKDSSLQQFYDTISGKNATFKPSAEQTSEEEETTETSEVNSESTDSQESQENVQSEENTDNGQGDEAAPVQ